MFVKDGSGNVVALTADAAPIYARVEKNAGQSFSSGVTTTVTYQSVIEDASSVWDSGNNQYVVPAAANGKIAVISVEHQDSADGTTASELFIERSQNSGSSWSRVAQSPNGGLDHFGILSATAILKVSTGDWFRVRRVANEAKTSASDIRCSFTFCTLNAVKGDTGATGPAASPSGATGSIQYNNAGAFGGAANVDIDGGDLTIAANTSPATPASGNVKLFGKTLGNTRVMAAAVGASGMDYTLQPSIWRQKISRWNPSGNSNAVPGVDGFVAWTAVGTATARNVATTNLMTRMRRLAYVSAATAGSLASLRTAQAQFTTGTGTGLGGFFASFRFAFSDAAAVSGARAFVGFSSATGAPTNVEPNTLTNSIGIAQLSTAADRLYLVYGGSAAQTAIDLTTSFPPYNGTVGVTTGVPYDFTIWCPPNGNGVIHWQLDRLDTNTSTAGTITPGTPGTQTPANTTLLNPVIWRCNNATALAVGIDISNVYIETDY